MESCVCVPCVSQCAFARVQSIDLICTCKLSAKCQQRNVGNIPADIDTVVPRSPHLAIEAVDVPTGTVQTPQNMLVRTILLAMLLL